MNRSLNSPRGSVRIFAAIMSFGVSWSVGAAEPALLIQAAQRSPAPPAAGTLPGMPFSIHHTLITQFGIHHLEDLNLAAMAKDKVWTSCAMVMPSRDLGAAGAAIRPVAVGVPNQMP
jgi:hypothetical protein